MGALLIVKAFCCSDSADISKNYIQLLIAGHEHQVFLVKFMDNKHCMISCEEIFHGPVDSASVYPREVAKAAHASSVIFIHNHPSGVPEASQVAISITRRLTQALVK